MEAWMPALLTVGILLTTLIAYLADRRSRR